MWAHLGIVTLEPEKLVAFVLILLLFSYILTAVADARRIAQHSKGLPDDRCTFELYQMSFLDRHFPSHTYTF